MMRVFKILLPLFLLIPGFALAGEPLENLNFIGRYDFDFSGIYLGNLIFSVKEASDHYEMHLLVRSGGIVNLFTRHTSDTLVEGKHIGNDYLPEHYESHYKTKDKPRHVVLAFNEKGAIAQEVNEPPEDRTDRAEVPHNLKDGAYDPLTGFMIIRTGTVKFRTFDAKRLYDITSTAGGKNALRLENGIEQTLSYTLSRVPLAGMTAKEMKDYKKGEPPLAVYFSSDARKIPLLIVLPIYFGSLQGRLTKECSSWEECIK